MSYLPSPPAFNSDHEGVTGPGAVDERRNRRDRCKDRSTNTVGIAPKRGHAAFGAGDHDHSQR